MRNKYKPPARETANGAESQSIAHPTILMILPGSVKMKERDLSDDIKFL
jgi:hypothetical protein